jgi:hypothetical protein
MIARERIGSGSAPDCACRVVHALCSGRCGAEWHDCIAYAACILAPVHMLVVRKFVFQRSHSWNRSLAELSLNNRRYA